MNAIAQYKLRVICELLQSDFCCPVDPEAVRMALEPLRRRSTISLRDASDVYKIPLERLKKRVQRACLSPVDRRGMENLYRISEVIPLTN
ncbi:MAG: hypothetical protein ACI4SG_00645 [Oligosphaeraceae bacterium]